MGRQVADPRQAFDCATAARTHPWPVDDDAELARRAAAGDRAAWSAIYDRYADRLHDYCWSILRDRHEAEDALHDAFVAAAGKIGQLRDPALLRPWLYAICRNQALARTRRRGREVPSEDVAGMTPPVTDGTAHRELEVEQLRRLVWDAAGGLAPRDRSVLELHLRHGLEGRQLAEALGTNPHHAAVLLARVREHVERSIGALLVGRAGRGRCAELDGLLAGWGGELSPLLRKRLARHIDRCLGCGEQRRRVVSPLALLSGLPLLPAPAHLRGRVLDDVALVSHAGSAAPGGSGASSGRGDRGGWPGSGPGRALHDHRVAVLAGAAGLTALVLLGAVLVGAGRRDGVILSSGASGTHAGAGQPSSSGGVTGPGGAFPGSAGSAAGSTPAQPGVLQLLTSAIDLGATATESPLRFRNGGAGPLRWSLTANTPGLSVLPTDGSLPPGATATVTVRLDRATVPEGAFTGSVRLVADRQRDVPVAAAQERPPVLTGAAALAPWLVPSSPCDRARAVVTVTDESPVTVTLSWGFPGGLRHIVPMAGAGGSYSALLGPVALAGTVRWWVSATDQRGNTGRSPDRMLEVRAPGAPCP